jgi:uncharacterized membrane protein YbhN (UPF0104 family)
VLADLGRVLGIEAVLVLLQAVRLGAALAALGIDWDATAALTLASAASLAAAVGFLPGGVGIREAIAGALAPLIGLSAGDALVATVFDRAASLAVVALAAVVVLRVEPAWRARVAGRQARAGLIADAGHDAGAAGAFDPRVDATDGRDGEATP